MARKHLVLLNMIGVLALVMVDQTVLGVILPSLQRTFMFGPVHLQWSVNAYLIALASMLMCGGWLGDKFGYFTSLRMGLALFTAASLACAYAPTGEFFITARVFQGAGAALMQPAATALVFSAYPADERGKALAHYVGAGLFFLACGPLVGGLLVEFFSWRIVFLLNVPIGLAVLIMAFAIGKSKTNKDTGSFDFQGAILFVMALLVFTVAVQLFGDYRLSLGEGVVSAGFVILVCSLLFVRRHHVAHPFIQFSLFENKVYLGCCLLLFCIPFALLAQVVFGAVFLQNVLSLTPLEAGLSMLPVVLTIIVCAQFGGRLVGNIKFRNLAVCGSLAMGIGFATQALVIHFNNLWLLFPGMILMGAGLGFLISTVSTEALSHVSLLARARATALLQTCRQVGGVFGIACVGALINWREKTMISAAAELMEPNDKDRELLQLLLYKFMGDQPAAAALLHERWPQSLYILKAISSRALADAYIFSAVVLFGAAVMSLWAFKGHTPRQRPQGSDGPPPMSSAND
ncbi:MFS transporter [Pseudovibrio brasiliensis]|uniref:MFS transporter n=1 Tax=Pseudovibrio brasiliensis TaxID=1898042 RepID=A0ABX8AVT4_9HYPH|nr:MFS transporter [Pseudovibrio brasiliensis]QUS58723.1 MFS transporter [Pseudovibrio brasiliensis]